MSKLPPTGEEWERFADFVTRMHEGCELLEARVVALENFKDRAQAAMEKKGVKLEEATPAEPAAAETKKRPWGLDLG